MDIFRKDPVFFVFEKIQKFIVANKQKVVVSIAIAFFFIAAFWWYLIYRANVQVNSHKDFSYAMKYFNAPVVGIEAKSVSFDTKEFKTKEEKWKKVEELFSQGYSKNKSAGLAPIFLAYQAEALLNQGKLDSAISVLKKTIEILKSKPVQSYYKVKLALMQIDSADKKQQNEGVAILQDLALDDKGIAHDRALYYLGNYYWHNKKFDNAKNYWNQLILKYGKSSQQVSSFVAKARQKLKLISFKS